MKKTFIMRVLVERIVDTKQYRYIRRDRTGEREQWYEIQRLPLSRLDTTAEWETVYDSRKDEY